MAPPLPAGFSRRRFLGGAVTLVCAAPVVLDALACQTAAEPGPIDGWKVPGGTTLDRTSYALLCATFDALIPGDAKSPGATVANAPWYLDQLLGAFRVDPPRIFAGGPYSGRHGGVAGFEEFQPLTRVETLRWRTYLEGSQGIPEREWNGPVVGLFDRYRQGLAALDAAAVKSAGKSFTALTLERRRTLLQAADPEFLQLAYEHAVEGTYGDPVYGGNQDRSGWKAIDYEGDRQPVGYTPRQMSNPEEPL